MKDRIVRFRKRNLSKIAIGMRKTGKKNYDFSQEVDGTDLYYGNVEWKPVKEKEKIKEGNKYLMFEI